MKTRKRKIIKFRLWDIAAKTWWKSGSYELQPERDLQSLYNYEISRVIFGPNNAFRKIEEFEFEQFTGLKDKNGKEIYEGDILKESSGTIIAIEWNHAGFAARYISGPSNQNLISYLTDCYMVGTPENSEIIGNIHQNSDLLK